MNTRSKDIPLNQFRDWLLSSDRAASTVTTYLSQVRTTLRELGGSEHDLGKLEAYFDTVPFGSRAGRLSAWRIYTQFLRETFGTELPVPGDKRSEGKEAPVELPEEIRKSVRALRASNFSYREISCLAWGDVDVNDLLDDSAEFIHVTSPTDRTLTSWVPREAIQVLLEWIGGESAAGEHKPLVPRTPSSHQPYPPRSLQRQLAQGQLTPLERARLLREQEKGAKESGSALEVAEAFEPLDVLKHRKPVTVDEGVPSIAHKYPSKFRKAPPSGKSAAELLGIGSSTTPTPASPAEPAGVHVSASDPHLEMAAEMMKNGVSPEEAAKFVMEMRKLAKVGSGLRSVDPNDPDDDDDGWEEA